MEELLQEETGSRARVLSFLRHIQNRYVVKKTRNNSSEFTLSGQYIPH